ncbi:MAG TPA: thioredoxin domain-containing protein, partial [Gemmataceae bacterium]|nr:thioredoxin domain-containing protein [Gemmataceae bacterium]
MHQILVNRLLMAMMLLSLVCTVSAEADTPAFKKDKDRPANRLARETSPYLLMHAHNPVDWFPWGPEAFAKAKNEGKMVFLSIGYSSCYWCHVMERESFQNSDVAKLLNQWFVCIKVDREERPDIDSIYMTALNALGQQGGWPLSMFLTAEGKPIIGGTYWPAEDREIQGEKVRGFKSILQFIHDWNKEKPDEVTSQADKLEKAAKDWLAGQMRGIALVTLDRSLAAAAVDSLKEEFDTVHGGFGPSRRTKFPVPPSLELLIYEGERTKSAEVDAMLALTLDRMARGGIYDQLGGGFHRYSTERTWTVPHFEKMLYDNAQLVEVYSRAYRRTPKPLYQRIVRETLAFVLRELTAPEGGFYSALDAETSGEEGRFYVWTDKEIDLVLGNPEESSFIKKVYGADTGFNFENKYHIFVLPKPIDELAKDMKLTEEQLVAKVAPLRKKLFEARSQRPRPLLDTKILTSWNGQMIAGFAIAGQVFQEPRYIAAGARAADFVLHNLRTPQGRLLRTFAAQPGQPGLAKLNGYLDDYANLVYGLLCLHDATDDKKWLDEAKSLTDIILQFHADQDRGGFFYTSSDHEKLFARAKDQYDSVQPAGNSVAAGNLVRLWTKTGDAKYKVLAEKTFKAFAGALKSNPGGLTAMAHHLGWYLDALDTTKTAEPGKPDNPGGRAKKSDSVVKIQSEADKPNAEGIQVISIKIAIDEGWHLYANPVPQDFPGIPVTVTLDANRKSKVIQVDHPKGKSVRDAIVGDHQIYEGKVSI